MGGCVNPKTYLLLAAFSLMISTASSGIIYVDVDASGANNGSSWADAYKYLQDALTDANSAIKPVEIRVTQGTYRPGEDTLHPEGMGGQRATFQLINGVTLKGGYAGFGEPDPNARDINAYETILNRGWNSCHIVTGSGTDTTAVIDGFTITGGSAGGPTDQERCGGGLCCWTGNPTVINCIFSGNYAAFDGGGMYFRTGSPVVTNCIFRDNSADEGGGMFCDSATLRNCTFRHNWALSEGGGMLNWGRSVLINCTFIENWAGYDGGGMFNFGAPSLINCTFSGNSAGDFGGGMESFDPLGGATLVNCIFEDNSAAYGGGMNGGYGATLRLSSCIFRRNSAYNEGGGMCNWAGSLAELINCTFSGNLASQSGGGISNKLSILSLTNCVFSGNTAGDEGGGIYHKARDDWENLTIKNCTFAGNSEEKGNTLYFTFMYPHEPITVQFANCILWDGGMEIWNSEASKITIAYTDVRGGQTSIYDPCGVVTWAEGNIDVDPCFVEPGYWDQNDTPDQPWDDFWVDGDYHLLEDSPCINAGDPNYVAEPNETDLDGRPRVMGGRMDMGAYEYSPPIQADVRIVPRTINLASKGKWIAAFLLLPEKYNVADIDPDSVLLGGEIEPQWVWFDEEEQVAMVRFSRQELQGILAVGEVGLTITVRLTDGTIFEAKDVIIVINKGSRKSAKQEKTK